MQIKHKVSIFIYIICNIINTKNKDVKISYTYSLNRNL